MAWQQFPTRGKFQAGVLPGQWPKVAFWLVALGVSVALGAAVTVVQGDVNGHRDLSFLAILFVLAASTFVLFAQFGSAALIVWPPLAVAGYLLVEVPRAHPIITFDRLWVGGLVAYIVLTPAAFRSSRASRIFGRALVCFICLYGIRAVATQRGLSGPTETWFDGVVLPAIVFFAVSRYAVTRARVERLAASLMVAGGILGGIGIAERLFGFELATLSGGVVRHDENIGLTRVSGPYPVPEPYALALVMCLAATLYWIQTHKRGLALWGVLFAGMEVSGIAFSLFRAAWIAGLLVLIGALGIRPRRFGRTLAVTAIVAAFAGAASTQLQHNRAFAERTQNTDNIYGRLATYQEGVSIFDGAPLTGIGVDRYHEVALRRQPTTYHNVEAVNWPHSSYVAVLAEQGLVGFIPLLVVSVAGWYLIRRLRASAPTREDGILAGALGGAGAGYMIMSLTLTMLPYEPSNAFFALLLGMGAGRLNSIESQTLPEDDAPARLSILRQHSGTGS